MKAPNTSRRKGESDTNYEKRLIAYQELHELQRYRFYCELDVCDGKPHATADDWHPHPHARKPQQYPTDSYVTAWITGRGFGKTRTAAEAVKDRMLQYKDHRVGVIAPTFGLAKNVCLEGAGSGLLNLFPPEIDAWNCWRSSTGTLQLKNGSRLQIFGADQSTDAEAIRGYQFNTVWFDELATIRHGESAWDMAMFANRLPRPEPKVFVTTTPKPLPIISRLYKMENCTVIRGSLEDNRANLSPLAVAELKAKYEGTRLGRQELNGELLEDIPGSLWNSGLIEKARWKVAPEDLLRVVVAVDPAGSSNKDSDETGIVVAGLTKTGEICILADESGIYTPTEWAYIAVGLFGAYNADRVVAETNFGGDLVEQNLRSADPGIPFKKLTASRGKVQRAEPIVSLYEQGRVHHVGTFPELEQQMCSFVPGLTAKSPDRMDALVWACTELAIQKRRPRPLITHVSSI